jgi:hypothetical protein
MPMKQTFPHLAETLLLVLLVTELRLIELLLT